MSAAPRLRSDLEVTPFMDGDGVSYYDVSDPRTGGMLRLYDFEWLVAERLDGERTLEELSKWTQEFLGFEASKEDLEVYVRRLNELGFFDAMRVDLPAPTQAAARESPPELARQAAPPMASSVALEGLLRAEPRFTPSVAEQAQPAEAAQEAAAMMEAPLSERTTAPMPALGVEVGTERAGPAAPAPEGPAARVDVAVSGAAEQPARQVEPAQAAATPAQADLEMPPLSTEEEFDEVVASNAGRWIAVLVVLVALAVAVYFLFRLRNPPLLSVDVVRVVQKNVTRTTGGTAVVREGKTQVLRMEAGGLVQSVVSEGAEVSVGMSLAALESQARIHRNIAELRERLAYYQRRRDVARDKGESAAEREAQAKVNEKQERLASAEAALKKTHILAARAGKVGRVMVRAGDLVTPGSEILEITDRSLGAEMRLPLKDAEAMKVGQEVHFQAPGGQVLKARVSSLGQQGGQALVELELPVDAQLKAGDELRLVRERLTDVQELPAAAITQGDTVYVMSQGKASRRRITVVDHDGANVYVRGLYGGDEVIVSRVDELSEGQPVRPR